MENPSAKEVEGLKLFILCVKECPCLYEKSDPFYFKKEERTKAWQYISERTNTPIQDCRIKWKAIREKFSREIKKQECPTESGAADGTTWDLIEDLKFLRQSVKRRGAFNKSVKSEAETDEDASAAMHFLAEVNARQEEPEPPPSKRKTNNNLDGLCDQFGGIIRKIEQQFEAPSPSTKQIEDDDDGDAEFFSFMRSSIKCLPVHVKDNFKTEMTVRLMQLRAEYRNS